MSGPDFFTSMRGNIPGGRLESFLSETADQRTQTPLMDTRRYGPSDITKLDARDLLVNENNLQTQGVIQAEDLTHVADAMRYGDFANIQVTAGLNNQLILDRPQGKRIYLLIQNTHATQNMFVAFGTIATALNGIKINPGGNLFLDTIVPQNEVQIIADGAGTTGVVVYCNKDWSQK